MALWRSLSGRLLILTVIFVMLAEVLIFVPSIARFREQYLRERLEKAQIASLAARAAPDAMVPSELERELLMNSEVFLVAIKHDDMRQLILFEPTPTAVYPIPYDLRERNPLVLIRDALICMFQTEWRFIRVVGDPFVEGDVVEIIVDEHQLKRAMLDYGLRIFILSLIIAGIAASLVFVSVNYFVVRPMRDVVESMVHFRADPEGPERAASPRAATGEIARADAELAATQQEIRRALKQKKRLADLGAAVAKINHDLRNILASAQLLVDRLEPSQDPIARRVAPKLIGSMERATRLCRQTLEYGKAEEAPPQLAAVPLRPLVDEIGAALGAADDDGDGVACAEGGVAFRNAAPDGLGATADPDHLFRALLNLTRNAAQAIEATGRGGAIAVEARANGRNVEIDVVDDGPGLPPAAQDKLFLPFQGSGRPGGSGLGLAIAHELIRGHGGDLELIETGDAGTRFRISLPIPNTAEGARNGARRVNGGQNGDHN